jgi:hypothetical protein
LREQWVKAYSGEDPETPRVFGPHEVADAEPALPGWRMPVADLFEGERHS